MIKSFLKRMARRCGYEIRRASEPIPGTDWTWSLGRMLADRPAPVLFDVGANHGEVTALLLAAFPAPARILAFEPTRETFTALTARFAGEPRVHAEARALAAAPGEATLYHGLNAGLNRLTPPGELGRGSSETVVVDTIDRVARRHGVEKIDFLKIDTEGHELAVLQGAAEFLAAGGIDVILVEVTFESSPEWHTAFSALQDFLAPRGFCLHGIYDQVIWGPRMKYANVLFVREAALTTDRPPA